jgi:GNAT superfamily N-acetyltransferase
MLRAQIEGARVAAPHRGHGLGRAMIEWAIGQAREHGCGLVQLTSDKRRHDAVRFYESLGFTASHEGLKLSL